MVGLTQLCGFRCLLLDFSVPWRKCSTPSVLLEDPSPPDSGSATSDGNSPPVSSIAIPRFQRVLPRHVCDRARVGYRSRGARSAADRCTISRSLAGPGPVPRTQSKLFFAHHFASASRRLVPPKVDESKGGLLET